MSFTGVTGVETYSRSNNHQWCVTDILGRGATAIVYKARNLTSGEVCAVKVFHARVSAHHSSVPERELELLQKMKHRNIIAIFGWEQEAKTGNDVIAMELCSGGSLYSMLDKPKFAFGFPEEEFLIVLKDISDGLSYLRQSDIIHRDIKPGNIMRKIDDNGKSIYKLTDFGAARSLQEEETFTSIYGTEEYLDPSMYERAVLRRHPVGDIYGADVDLWSLGVTIYHVATGSLPFQPYGGRSNAETMHFITTQKKSGVISGIQRTEKGEIEWNTELPKTCALSNALKSIVTPIIAGLLESVTRKRWSFQQYFNSVNTLMNKTTMKIFDCSTGVCNKLYVDNIDRYARFQELVAKTTDIPSGDQLILFTNRELCEVVEMTKEVQNWPKAVVRGQLFLYEREKLNQQRLVLPEIPPLPQFPSKTSLDRDCYVAHKMAAITCLIERYITTCLIQQEVMLLSETYLRDFILRITRNINNSIPDMCKLLEEHKHRQEVFYDSYTAMSENIDVIIPCIPKDSNYSTMLLDKQQRIVDVLKDRNPWTVLHKAESRASECKVYMDVLMQKIKEQEEEAISYCVGCLEEDHCLKKAEYISSKACDIHLVFLKQKKQRNLPGEEMFSHESDRAKMMDYCIQIVSLLQSHCLLNLTKVYNVVGKQITLLLKNLQRTKKVDQNITSVNECREKLSNRMERMEKECKEMSSQIKTIMESKIKGVLKPLASTTREQIQTKEGDTGYETGESAKSSPGQMHSLTKSSPKDQAISMVAKDTQQYSSFTSISHKLESGFADLNKDSLDVQRDLERNEKMIQNHTAMVSELLARSQINLSHPADNP